MLGLKNKLVLSLIFAKIENLNIGRVFFRLVLRGSGRASWFGDGGPTDPGEIASAILLRGEAGKTPTWKPKWTFIPQEHVDKHQGGNKP